MKPLFCTAGWDSLPQRAEGWGDITASGPEQDSLWVCSALWLRRLSNMAPWGGNSFSTPC